MSSDALTAAVPTLDHSALVHLLRRAYSGEKAAALAYIGHAASLRDPAAKAAVKQIERDEWEHRAHVLAIMQRYGIAPSRWLEVKLHIIGLGIAGACHVIGRFMPFFFAGKLESGNVCEYFVMMQHFQSLGIGDHDAILYAMGIKEKEHEVYFLKQIEGSRWLPFFERVFSWGASHSRNDVNLAAPEPIEGSSKYCRRKAD